MTTSNAWGTNVVLQPNGATLEVGTANGSGGHPDFVVARYSSNGTLDTSFGGGGYTLVDMGAATWGDSVALQPNGQIVAAGLLIPTFNKNGTPLTWGYATARLNTNGSLDTSFGTGGTVITQVLGLDQYSVAVGLETIDSQPMIVDAGTASNSGANQEFGLVRYTPNGSVDPGVLMTHQPPAIGADMCPLVDPSR